MPKASVQKKEVKPKQDPVCKKYLADYEIRAVSKYKRRIYYFCSNSCMEKFNKTPESYVK